MKKNILRILVPVLLIAVLICAVPTAFLITGHAEPVRNMFNTMLMPFERATAFCGEQIRRVTDYFTEFDRLKEENTRLREQLASMEDKVREAELTLDENAFLSEFLELKENHADYRFIKCEVVACDEGGYYYAYTLNVGSGEGVAIGYPVITSAGVVGRITEVGTNWSRAESILSVSSSVGAYAERCDATGVAKGDYAGFVSGTLLFTYYEEGADIRIGDRIRTSGISSYYPRGLLIGEVTGLSSDPATNSVVCSVKPAYSHEDIRDVMILTDFAILEQP